MSSGSTTLPFDFDMTLPSLQHHALRQQARERLVVLDQAEVAEDAAEEPRVDQVQNGVLDAAAVEVDRGTSTSRPRARTAAGRCADRRTGRSTRTSRRTCPSCPSRAAPDRRTPGTRRSPTPATWASGESPRPVNSATFGSTTGSWSSGTGTMPHRSQADHRDRRAPVALARDPPVLQPELHRPARRSRAPRRRPTSPGSRRSTTAPRTRRSSRRDQARRRPPSSCPPISVVAPSPSG